MKSLMKKTALFLFVSLCSSAYANFTDDLMKIAKDEVKKQVNKSIDQYFYDKQDKTPNSSTPSQSSQNEVRQRGNKKEHCGLNTYNGILPTMSKSFYQGSGGENEILTLCYHGFTAQYKNDYHISLWVAEKLSPEREEKSKEGEREETFYPDPTVKRVFGLNKTIKTNDYIGLRVYLDPITNTYKTTNNANLKKVVEDLNKQGYQVTNESLKETLRQYDRGHLSASRNNEVGGDRFESFYTTNIVPQTAENNRNIWKEIENKARCLAVKHNADVYTVTIPALDINRYAQIPPLMFKTRDGNNIVVPDKMAKAFYIPKLNIAGAYITNNDKSKTHYEVISINDLRQYAYIDPFPFLSQELKGMKPTHILNNPKSCK